MKRTLTNILHQQTHSGTGCIFGGCNSVLKRTFTNILHQQTNSDTGCMGTCTTALCRRRCAGRRRAEEEPTEAGPVEVPTVPVDPKLAENIKIFEQFMLKEAAEGLWEGLDKDVNGQLTPEEIYEAMASASFGLTKEDVVAIFGKTELVTREEFMASMFGIQGNEDVVVDAAKPMPKPRRRQAIADPADQLDQDVVKNMIANLWKHLDSDKSGDLTQDELTKGLTELGVPITKEEVAKAFGDKKTITKEEFEAVANDE